jgi:hypothetical protein
MPRPDIYQFAVHVGCTFALMVIITAPVWSGIIYMSDRKISTAAKYFSCLFVLMAVMCFGTEKLNAHLEKGRIEWERAHTELLNKTQESPQRQGDLIDLFLLFHLFG